MQGRITVCRELASLFGVLSNPHRIRIVEELRAGEMDVNALRLALGLSHSAVSQHLGVLRAHRMVSERREGRHVIYHLNDPHLAAWVLAGLDFIESDRQAGEKLREAMEQVRALWGGGQDEQAGVEVTTR